MENLELGGIEDIPMVEVPKEDVVEKKKAIKQIKQAVVTEDDLPMNCLRNEKITVRFIPRESGHVTDPKHPLYGGMHSNAERVFTVPTLNNGQFVNILTNEEKSYLEYIMGLEVNALSVYLKTNNYWNNYQVRLIKGDNLFDLSNPQEYIDYKVLLANKDQIAPSLRVLQDLPKATYQFVIIAENEEQKNVAKGMTATMNSYMELGKIIEDIDTMRVIVETISGRPTAANSKQEFLQTQCNKLIQNDPNTFLSTIKDPLLPNKVLIKRAKDNNVVTTKGNFYYFNNTPLCGANEEPTLSVAAKYLGLPKNAEIKYAIEARINS